MVFTTSGGREDFMATRHKLIVVLLVLGLTSLAQTQDIAYGRLSSGTVKAIDVKKKAVTILHEDNKQTTVVTLGDAIEVLLDRKPATFDQIKEKQLVRAYFVEQAGRKVLKAFHIFVETSPPPLLRGKEREAIARLLPKDLTLETLIPMNVPGGIGTPRDLQRTVEERLVEVKGHVKDGVLRDGDGIAIFFIPYGSGDPSKDVGEGVKDTGKGKVRYIVYTDFNAK
jgi:Cu/Ag efflux protein CusF